MTEARTPKFVQDYRGTRVEMPLPNCHFAHNSYAFTEKGAIATIRKVYLTASFPVPHSLANPSEVAEARAIWQRHFGSGPSQKSAQFEKIS